jgi:hypothetical protein
LTRNYLAQRNICLVFVPACCTGELQPLDLTVNGAFKRCQREHFRRWYGAEIKKQLDNGVEAEALKIDMALSVVKPQHARWLIETCHYLASKHELMVKGFEMAGILQGWEQFDQIDRTILPQSESMPFALEEEMQTEEAMASFQDNDDNSSDDELTISQFVRKRKHTC